MRVGWIPGELTSRYPSNPSGTRSFATPSGESVDVATAESHGMSTVLQALTTVSSARGWPVIRLYGVNCSSTSGAPGAGGAQPNTPTQPHDWARQGSTQELATHFAPSRKYVVELRLSHWGLRASKSMHAGSEHLERSRTAAWQSGSVAHAVASSQQFVSQHASQVGPKPSPS